MASPPPLLPREAWPGIFPGCWTWVKQLPQAQVSLSVPGKEEGGGAVLSRRIGLGGGNPENPQLAGKRLA